MSDQNDTTTDTTADVADTATATPAPEVDTTAAPDAAPAATAVETDEPTRTFADFGVRPETVEALAAAGVTTPFPIQALTLPIALTGQDIIGQAKTGTGKTLGFGIPLLERVIAPGEPGADELAHPGAPQALVVVPTRELAVQVHRDLQTAGARRPLRIEAIYGGRAYEPQVEALKRGVEIVVGTPGRLIDLAHQGLLDLSQVHGLVMDEADEMLDLGFLPDVERIIAMVPEHRQTMLFSATMPGQVVGLARRYMTHPTHIRAQDPEDDSVTVRKTRQLVYRCHPMDKVEVVARILQAEGRGRTIIFTRTKRTAAKVCERLQERGFAAGAIHGDLGQGAREQALRAFRHGKIDVLVATDVAARGIDVDDVTHVINYQAPEDEKMYIHRIGRTGRAGHKGTAVTFVDWDDVPRWKLINKALGLDFFEPVETYSTSPHLFTDLDIPKGTKGRLPRDKQVLEGLDAEEIEDLGETGPQHSDDAGREASRRGGRREDEGSRSHGRGSDRHDDSGSRGDEDRPKRRRHRRGGRGEGAAPERSDTTARSQATDHATRRAQRSHDAEWERTPRKSGGRGRGRQTLTSNEREAIDRRSRERRAPHRELDDLARARAAAVDHAAAVLAATRPQRGRQGGRRRREGGGKR